MLQTFLFLTFVTFIAACGGFGAAFLMLRPTRRERTTEAAARLLRRRFARGEIDALLYDEGMWILGLTFEE